VSPGLFSTFQIPLKRGRFFTDLDTTRTEEVAIVDEDVARQYWPNEDPVGRQIQPFDGTSPAKIVGIVGHVKTSTLTGDSDRGIVYYPMYQKPQGYAALLVRTDADPGGLANTMKEAVAALDPNEPLVDLQTMDERVSSTLTLKRFAVFLLGLFGAIALFMAALGLYGVINYGVAQRTQEIGIRMALGAQRGEVLRLIIGQGLRLTIVGIGLGLLLVLALARLISNQLFQVSAFDPPTLIGMAAALLLVALGATYIPARRAASIDPLEACHYE
jgi:predicted permease